MRKRHLVTALLALPALVLADEGMWLFTKPPVEKVKSAYGFEITPAWLEHLQKSAVRFGTGGSGSFVSPDGLILTNHHVGSGMIEKLSTQEKDLRALGFYAASLEEELPCPDLELNVLMSIEDVTARVRAAVKDDMSADEAKLARTAVIGQIEKESLDATGFRSDVVKLYQGGAYHLYRYHRYTDVRLVFAPDEQAAAFGRDPDNFEFPRFCLDMCFFRAYEDGKPVKSEHFLKWNAQGAKEGELVFVAGHPGRTNRLATHAELEDMRDHGMPGKLEQIYRSEALLEAWASRDRENRRRATGAITGTRNGRKAILAGLDGLLDPEFMAAKLESEQKLRDAFRAKPEWQGADEAFQEISAALKANEPRELRARMLEGGEAFATGFFGIARTLVRAADEHPKENSRRLREFQEAGRISLELDLFSNEPIYRDMETLKLANSLMVLCAKLGANNDLVEKIMAGKAPQERAAELVAGTKLDDVAVRKSLYEGGKAAIDASSDPMILLAKLVDGPARVERDHLEEEAEILLQSHEKIATARFAIEGDSSYPDATFSLRLAYGVVKGYQENGVNVPWATTMGGLFERSGLQGDVEPFDLPQPWRAAQDKINRKAEYNFVCTADITGGNSGSPVVNKAGELVGLIFDSNAPGLKLGYGYKEGNGRAVSVHSAGMLEALDTIYGAKRVLEELEK